MSGNSEAAASGGRRREPRKLDQERLWEYALRLLRGRAQSTGELRARLSRRAERSADVDAVLRRLKQYGFVDDKKFAESYAAARLENEGHGKARVLRDLRQKRVAGSLAQAVVSETYATTDEMELIEQFLSRKYRKVSLPKFLAEPKNLAAAYRRLRYAGFSGGNSIRVLRRYSELAENFEDAGGEEPE